MFLFSIPKSQGMVLLMVLMILQLIMELTLHQYDYLFRKRFLQTERWNQYQSDLLTEQAFAWIEQHFFDRPCLIERQPIDTLTQHTEDWWRQWGCVAGIDNRYDYVIEHLTDDPCGVIATTIQGKPLIAQYYRVTLLDTKHHFSSVLLQRTLVMPIVSQVACNGLVHFVRSGYQH